MIENPGLIEYLLSTGGALQGRELQTAQQIKRFTDEMPGGFFIYQHYTGEVLYVNHALMRTYSCKKEE